MEIAGGSDTTPAKRGRQIAPTNEFEPFDLEEIEQSIPSRFEQQVRRYPDRLAVRSRDQCFTYAELNKAANRIAHAILEQCGEGEEQVALLLDQGAWVVAAIMGVLKAGKIYVPLDPRFPRPRLTYMIEDAQISLILTDFQNMPTAAELTPRKVPRINIHALSSSHPLTNPAIAISPNHGVNIIYTSGSTGNPKGVLQNHRNLLFEVLRVTNSFHVCRDDRLALLHPCSSSASLRRIFPALLNGASLYPLDLRAEGREDLPRWFAQEEITISNGRRLLRDCRHSLMGEDQFPRLRLVTFGGEPVYRSDVELYRRYLSPQCLMLINLAATETGSDCQYFIDKQTQLTDPLIPVGYATEGTEIFLLNEDAQEVGPGEVGEIAVKSRYLALGYWRQPELTRQRFLPDPSGGEARIYLSGDIGRMRSDGCLFYLGRKDFQVKIRGYRIEPIEVETALLNLGTFTEAVVLALRTVEDEPSGRFHLHAKSDNFTPTGGGGETENPEQINESEEKRLVAYLVPTRLPAPTVSDLRRSLSETLPEHMIPSVFVMLEQFPRAPSGKVDHAALAAHFVVSRPWRTRPALGHPFVAPRNAIEKVLAGIWAELLQIDTVGIDDSFLELGGDSLMATRVLSRIRAKFGINISPRVIFHAPTVAELSKALVAREPKLGLVEWTAEPRQEIRTMSAEDVRAELQQLEPGIQQQPPLVDNVADGYLESLNACAVDHIFINPGSGTAPIQESIAKFKAQGRRAPELILCLHESVAMAAAHGYFMVSGRPQVVLVNVDVGTQNIGANLHNAQRGRAGVVVCAGRPPYTVDGSLPGGRDRYIDWIQEQFSQASIVEGYVKWHYELTCRENLHVAVQRAFQVARTEPAGPVYLTLPREVLVQKMQAPIIEPNRTPVTSTPAADPDSLSRAAQWLIEADRPLILVAYAGRNPKAVASLVGLAEILAAPVVESRHRVNFPSGHPLHLGFWATPYLQQADCVLIVDHDVPWVPAQCRPPSECRTIHVDIDPLKRDIPIWGFPVDLAIQADSSQAMAALAEEVERRLSPADRTRIETRRRVVTTQHQAQRARWRQRALDLEAQRPIAPEWAAYCLSEIVDEDTVIVSEAVSNNPVLWHYLQLDTPGTYYQSLGSGLGWGLGAALGAKLASPSKTIICTLGDGSWMFGSPLVAYWAAEQHRSPFLTVIFNNQAYAATTEAILGIAPEGYARRTGNYPGCDLPKPPLYSRVAEAMGLWARTVDDPAKLQSVLREALNEVRRGRSALVDICVSSPRLVERMSAGSSVPGCSNSTGEGVIQ